jgi:hypothetical protein
MKLILLGIAADCVRLEGIAAGIEKLGHGARFLAFEDAPSLAQRQEDAAATGELLLHCWTSASAGGDARAFQDDALAAKEAGLYRGLVCDDVAVPAAVVGATDFRVGDDLRGVTRALEQHVARAQARDEGGFGWLRAQLADIVDRLRAIDRRWKILVVLGLIATILGATDALFSWRERLSAQPTEQQQREWNAIVAGKDCSAFAEYIERHGVKAPFADDARYRLDRAQEMAGPDEPDLVPITFAVPLSEGDFVDEASGSADAAARANAMAARVCEPSFVALGRWAEEPTASLNGPARCSPSGAGVRCSATATARCMTARPTVRRVCPLVARTEQR